MNNYLKDKNKLLCCGCRNCENICDQGCITMQEDAEGFAYPVMDKTNCIECGLCVKVCPISNKEDKNNIYTQRVYCAWANDSDLRKRSSSGGLFSILAAYVINNGGVVFGCAYDEDLNACHTYAETIEEIGKFRGSKYVQSDVSATFKKVLEYLKAGRLVLYSGTPCQIDALKAYLQKLYDNLLLVDLICEGVPSPKLFKKYLDYLSQKHKGIVTDFKFRYKCEYNSSLGCLYAIQKGSLKINKLISWYCSPYFYGFMRGLLYRPICYSCPYSNPLREGDITIGDFWGAENYFNDLEIEKGVSVVIVNSLKGEKLFEKIKCDIMYKESTFEDTSRKNGNLIKPVAKPEIRNTIYKELYSGNFEAKCKKYLRPKKYYMYYIASRIPQKIKTFFRVFVK